MKTVLGVTIALAMAVSANGFYKEVMDANGLTKNLKVDYGLVDDNAKSDQSARFQQAIDELSAAGGGNLIVPKGTYQFNGVQMKSNVHILVDAGTVMKPTVVQGSKSCVMIFDTKEPESWLENVSIRGVDGRFTVDYSDAGLAAGPRFIRVGQVRNFLIENVDIQDSRTPYSAMVFAPSKTKGANQWEVYRPTDGTIRNCSAFNSSHGYGLVQAHGGMNLLFENLYSLGGVTLRYETGAGGEYAGVFEQYGRNIVNENGAMAVVLFPHAVQNGNVYIDGVKAISSNWAVSVGGGGVVSKKDQAKPGGDKKPGTFGNGSYIKNIHAVFGKNAQIAKKTAYQVPEEYIKDLRVPEGAAYFVGPSVGVVLDTIQNKAYTVAIENVTQEGFTYNKGICHSAGKELKGAERWKFAKQLPGYEKLADKKAMKNYRADKTQTDGKKKGGRSK